MRVCERARERARLRERPDGWVLINREWNVSHSDPNWILPTSNREYAEKRSFHQFYLAVKDPRTENRVAFA